MAKQAIKLRVGAKRYSMNIDSEKEELYRLAEREVNQSLMEFEKQNFEGFSQMDYMSMTALKFAIKSVSARMQGEVNSDDVESLKRIESGIAAYLNDLSRE